MGSKQNRDISTMPTVPGFYWIVEAGAAPQIVEVVVACAAHNLLHVLRPGDAQRYPIDLWDDVLWCGPLATPEQPKELV